MADNVNDIIKKRLAARAASKLDVELPAPGLKGRFGLSAIDPDAYVRVFAPTLPNMPPLELSAKEVAQDVTDGYRNRDYAQDDRAIMIREQMERLNEAQGGGLAMFQQLRSEPGREFRSQDLTTYYVEAEGKFLIAKDVRGNFEAFELSTIGNMLERQAAQQREQGGVIPRTPVKKLKGPTQADTNNLIAQLKDRIRAVSQAKASEKVYEGVHQIAKETTDAYVTAASIPEKKLPAIGLDADKGKVTMVLTISEYGREEGKNMVRELREKGGEIEQHSLSYKVDGETFTRTRRDKTAFDYNAAEIEHAVDVRQKELGAIDVWESKSPALDLQARLADEIEQQNAHSVATSDEILSALAQLDDGVADEPRKTAEQIIADDKRILDERFERDLMPDSGSEPELTSEERKAAEDEERRVGAAISAREEARELGENIAAYGEDRGTDLVSELREKGGEIEHDGATYALDGDRLTRTRDGETTHHNAYDVKDGIDHQREDEQQSREAAMSPNERMEAGLSRPESVTEEQWQALEKQYEHDLLMDNTPEEFLPGTEAFARENVYGDDGEAGPYVSSEKELADHALGMEIAGYGKDRGTDLLKELSNTEGEIEHDGATYAYNRHLTISRTVDGETTEHNYTELREGIDAQREKEHAQAIASMPSELEALKAENAKLQEKLAALQQQQLLQQAEKTPQQPEASQSAVSSTPQEKAPERQQAAEQQQVPAEQQGKGEVSDKQVTDEVEGRSKGGWQRVAANCLEARKEAGEKIEDKPFVARARESEFAATAQRQQTHEQSQGQGLH
ncbi:hypothetical protein B5E41_29175 [Rhizobium esperanzae]|uniref:Uncharacterized protein n=1 Tax=Rhizobium esperanzae TaxID=1967781 RepID=A0A246DLD1_9HYPH|nr:hypothetical protein [Rhizobium esperanzae]OWO90001.1 hypothetical protein B5E41_29175 [Rhizobium esperanzae]